MDKKTGDDFDAELAAGQIDFETLSLESLQSISKATSHAIASYKDRKYRKAVARVEEVLAEEFDMTLPGLLSYRQDQKKKKKTPVRYKYRYQHPTDPDVKWSGAGHVVTWMRDYLNNGGDPRDLLIDKDDNVQERLLNWTPEEQRPD